MDFGLEVSSKRYTIIPPMNNDSTQSPRFSKTAIFFLIIVLILIALVLPSSKKNNNGDINEWDRVANIAAENQGLGSISEEERSAIKSVSKIPSSNRDSISSAEQQAFLDAAAIPAR